MGRQERAQFCFRWPAKGPSEKAQLQDTMLLQGLSVSDCHTHEGLALCSELCSGPLFPGRKSHYLRPIVPESFQCLSPRTSGMLLVLWTQQRENTCVTLPLSFALWKCSSSSVCLCDSIFTLTFRISWSPFMSLVQKNAPFACSISLAQF